MTDQKRVIVLLGKPGAGKGTQGAALSKAFGWAHISTGDLLREEMLRDTADGVKLRGIMERGQLVSAEIVVPILCRKIEATEASGVILDGFPRNLAQAELLAQNGVVVTDVLYFDVEDDEVISRLSGRWIHKPSGRVYHEVNNPPKVSGIDDVTGEQLVKRSDDSRDVIAKRLDVYRSETQPLLSYYEGLKGVQLHQLDVSHKAISVIQESVLSIFQR
ncbi:MAG: adenylate kinase family protein [Candidatus Comchoanobacterales bacterium]